MISRNLGNKHPKNGNTILKIYSSNIYLQQLTKKAKTMTQRMKMKTMTRVYTGLKST